MFPFEVPADLTALSAEQFAALHQQVREFAQATSADENATPELLIATRDAFNAVTAEGNRRTEQAAAATVARNELAAGLAPTEPGSAPEPEPAPAPTPDPVPTPEPSGTPPVTVTAARNTVDPSPQAEPERYGVLIASADAPGARGELTDFASVGKLLDTQFGRYGTSGGRGSKAPTISGGNRFRMSDGRSMTRHSIAAVQREYPTEFRVTDKNNALSVLEYARNERNLPGNSLAKSALKQVEAGKSLTAAAGWCAPSEIIYDLCTLSSLDGMLSLPTIQATRGGFQIPENGGPNFASIYSQIGDDGDVILTEYEVENGAEKVCIEVPCPDFVDIRLDVAYLCLTGNLLQQRGYPEAVTQFSSEAVTALAHKVNASMIARLVAGSGAPVTIGEPASSNDAASNLLSAVELAIMDMRYRHRMNLNTTVEVVLPAWVVGPIRASMARRQGVAELAVTDAEIMSWFTVRGAAVQFVYDWQDSFSGGTFGAQTAATAFPTTVSFLVYPAGTWVKGERDVINLDTVYDNAMLTQNQFTALFVEDGFSAMKMCADSRLYTTDVIPTGVVAARTLTAAV